MCEFQLSIAYKLTYINSIFSAVVVMEKRNRQPVHTACLSSFFLKYLLTVFFVSE